MKIRTKLVFTALLLLTSLSANAQLIGEGDTLWYKGGFPEIKQVLFTPDGTKLGVLGAVDVGVFTMFDALNGNELWTFKLATHYFKQFAYSNDGSKVFILPPSYAKINVLDVNTGLVLDALPVLKGENILYEYNQVYQTKNPNILLLANGTECFALYDIAERKIIKERRANVINKIFACPYSDYFISAYQYKSENKWKTTIIMYDINTLEYVATLGEVDDLVEMGGEIKISYNGKYAATNFGGRALQIWDLENKKLFKEYPPTIPTDSTSGRGPQDALAFTHNNENLINCGGRHIDNFKPSSTNITNIINDKRAIIYESWNFSSMDISLHDSYFVGGKYTTFYILKLHLDAVPVKEYSQNSDQEIYPNPATDHINIQLSNQGLQPFASADKIQIFDMLGIEVLTASIHPMTSSQRMNIEKLHSGVYFIRIGDKVEKILKM